MMDLETKRLVISRLGEEITPERKALMEEVLNNRTRHITVVLEDLHKTQNTAAILRNCDGFGIQDVHLIENSNAYRRHKDVDRGAHKWVTLQRHRRKENNTPHCFSALKENGYRIAIMDPAPDAIPIAELDVETPTALVFGTELHGLSSTARELADIAVVIPMHGFSQSFNVSVAASLSLFYLVTRLRQSNLDWGLSEEEKVDIHLEWMRRSVRNGDRRILDLMAELKNNG